jgi:c(7)-type cytochrome triheme protein
MRIRLRALGPVALLAAGLSAAAFSGSLPKLPKDKALPQSSDSPGVVTFRHATHVDAGRPDCTTCHPKLFTITSDHVSTGSMPMIKHADMESGKACGSCHDGKKAHGLDDCTTCHEQEKGR